MGTMLQVGVLVYAGFVSYDEDAFLGMPGVESGANPSSYLLLALGTVLLTIGITIASFVIERSTVETKWRVRTRSMDNRAVGVKLNTTEEDPDGDMHILWFQKQHVVGDQSFNSFVLQAKEPCREILASRRSTQLAERIVADAGETNLPATGSTSSSLLGRLLRGAFGSIVNTRSEFFTLVGTVLGLMGFVLQFQGFRGVNWTCALVQLGAIAIMTAMRAWIRRGLVVRPLADLVIAEHEMDWLASNMASGSTRFWPEDEEEEEGNKGVNTDGGGNDKAVAGEHSRGDLEPPPSLQPGVPQCQGVDYDLRVPGQRVGRPDRLPAWMGGAGPTRCGYTL